MAREAHIYLYSEIGYWGTTAQDIAWQLEQDPGYEKIVLHINSPGGEVYEGYAIYNFLLNTGKPVKAIIEGLCASIATLICLAASEREMSEVGTFMIHNPWGFVEGEAKDFESYAQQLRAIETTCIAAYVKATGLTEQEVRDMMNAETFLTPQEALAKGFITSISTTATAAARAVNRKFKPVAKFNIKPNDTMSDTTNNQEIKTLGDRILSAIGVLAKWVKPKALAVSLIEGTTVYVNTTAESIAVGDMVYTDAEYTTPVADATHALEDGRSITTVAGAITVITEASTTDEATAALQAQITDLQNQLATERAEKAEMQASMQSTAKVLAQIQQDHERLKNTVPGGGQPPKGPDNLNVKDKPEEKAAVSNQLANNFRKSKTLN